MSNGVRLMIGRMKWILPAVFCAIAVGLIAAPVLLYGAWFPVGPVGASEEWSRLGSFLSGTSGIVVGALGFFALIYTIRLQQRQIDELAREAGTREAEQHLDRLLSLLAQLLADTDIRNKRTGAVVATGRDAFRHFYGRKFARIYCSHIKGPGLKEERELVRLAFDQLYRKSGSDFGQYFRSLYHAVRWVHEAAQPVSWKKRQMDLIFCRLSRFELVMLAYNCLSTRGEVRFKPLLEKYGLLEHLDEDLFLDSSHRSFFAHTAFAAPV